MREEMKVIQDYRGVFTGEFERYGKKQRYKPVKSEAGQWVDYQETVLLVNIRDENGKDVCDHLWFNLTKGFAALGEMSPGDKIRFTARVTPYVKGYVNPRLFENNRERDLKLSRPTKIERL